MFDSATDSEALSAFELLSKYEGIFPALESSHALAYAIKEAPKLDKKDSIIVNISGRGDKDLFIVANAMKDKRFGNFLKTESSKDGYNE